MVITTTDIQLFQILKEKLGEKEAEALVGFVDSKLKDNNEANLKVLATREDIVKLTVSTKEDIAKLTMSTKEDIAKLTMSTKEDIAKLTVSTKEDTARLELKISETKADMIKWMFIFWTGSILTTLGGLFAFLKIFLNK